MMDIICTLEKIKENAIHIKKDTKFFNPYSKEVFTLVPGAFSTAYRKRYAIKNGIVSIIDDNNQWYLIPAICGVSETLKLAGYIRCDMYVPCAEHCSVNLRSFPKKEKIHWNNMLAMASAVVA